MKFKNFLAGVLLISSTLSIPAQGANVSIDIEVAPPPLVVEQVPPYRAGYVWAPGYWYWDGHRHVWYRGRWIRERVGYAWVPERWIVVGGRYRFVPGRWEHRGERVRERRHEEKHERREREHDRDHHDRR
jgi:hypothetical protein